MALSREERLARAREKAKKLREKSKTRGRYADRMDWRPKAKIYLHPETEIEDRFRVWFPKEVEAKSKDEAQEKGNRRKKAGGKKKTKIANVPFVVDQDPKRDPFACFRKALREDDDIDGDDVVLVVGSGREKVELCKGEILAWEGYDYKKRLTVSKDVVFAALKIADSKGKAPKEMKWEVLTAPKSLGNEITKEMESEMDESGEEDGNPFFNPYPFIIEFDSSERGSDMYSARARPQESPTDEIAKLLEEDCPDISSEIELDDVDEIIKLIRDALVIDDFDFEVEGAGAKKEKAKKSTGRKRRRDEDEDEGGEDEAPEDEGGEEPEDEAPEDEAPEDEAPEPEKPKKAARRKSKPAPKKEPEPEPEDDEGEKADSEGEDDPPPKKAARKKRTVKKPKEEEKAPAWEPAEGEEYDECPACKGKVPTDATECPHCGAEFEVGDEEDPF